MMPLKYTPSDARRDGQTIRTPIYLVIIGSDLQGGSWNFNRCAPPRQDRLHHVPAHIRQPQIPPTCFESQQVQDGGVEDVDVVLVLDDAVAKLVALAWVMPPLTPPNRITRRRCNLSQIVR
jgi:hypothetical protein